MDGKEKSQLMRLRELGIDTNRLSYVECVDALIDKYLLTCDALEYDEEQRFKNELKRIQKPTN